MCDWPGIVIDVCAEEEISSNNIYFMSMAYFQNWKKTFLFPLIHESQNYLWQNINAPICGVFERIFEEVSSSLENKKYTKSLRYQQRVYLKEKWSTCYSPQLFTAGIWTTSRIESMNAVIKNYVNSNSEISDLFDFILNFEKSLIYKFETEEKKKQGHINPTLEKIQLQVSEYIFNMHNE